MIFERIKYCDVSMESLAKLKGLVHPVGSVTAGKASGVDDGPCALLLANEAASNNTASR
jgi:acetyl-CoA acetyltransferase